MDFTHIEVWFMSLSTPAGQQTLKPKQAIRDSKWMNPQVAAHLCNAGHFKHGQGNKEILMWDGRGDSTALAVNGDQVFCRRDA